MGIIAKIISALAVILPAVVTWWTKRHAARAQAEAEARVADIRVEPGPEWVRKFGGQQPGAGGDNADQAGPDQPGGNAGGRDHDG